MFSNNPVAGKIAIHPKMIYGNTNTDFSGSTFKQRLISRTPDNVRISIVQVKISIADELSKAILIPLPAIAT